MYIFRQNRYVALLIGAILVCLGVIYLLQPHSSRERIGHREMPGVPDASKSSRAVVTSVGRNITVNVKSGERPFQPAFLHLTTLEIKRPKKETGVSHTLLLKELAAERAWLRTQAAAVRSKRQTPDPLHPPDQLFFTRTKLLSQADKDQATWSYALDEEELLLLQKIVMAEAEGEPYEGKVAVTNVVLNRLRSANYPDTIKEVIYQKSQFSPVQNGRLNRVKPNKETIRAVNEALNGRKEVSDDTYYFLSLKLATDLTIARTKDKAEVIGNHTFYK
ncbi:MULTISPECIES: cell wall hydrolase [Paenibacillus]|uniref:cell wall hydrolase n=1 Tax=Paenibacillus TaxID=44249 RepID=UPI002FE36E4A